MKMCLLFFVLAVAPQYGKAAVTPCPVPKEALSSEAWGGIRAVPAGVIAAVSTPFGWQGLNQIYPSSIVSEHRWRRFLPLGIPTTVEYFSGKPSLNSIANSKPVLYLRASDLEASLPLFGEAAVRLSHLMQTREGRALPLTKGSTSLNQKWLYTSRQDVPVVVRKLSDSTIEVQPQTALKDGEYLVSLGLDGSVKYEFSVRCSTE
jgi:hypothetical protein